VIFTLQRLKSELKKSILIIGIHVLHRKEITLEKPLVVLKKQHKNIEIKILKQNTQMKYIIKAIVKSSYLHQD